MSPSIQNPKSKIQNCYPCDHCGLPVRVSNIAEGEPIFCCYGCYLVSRIVGNRDSDGERAWNLLRLGIGAFLAMNVMMISLLLYTGEAESSAVSFFRWMLLGLATPAVLLLVYPFVLGAKTEFARGRLSLDSLIALGALTAFSVSAVNTLRGAGYVYFDVATMLPALVTLGKLLEATAKARAGRLIRHLETLLPKQALRIEPDGPREVDLAELQPGNHLRVRPGERFAVDGKIIEGFTTIEEAAFTGELCPRDAAVGDEVQAGTINGQNSVVVQAERVGKNLLLRRIIEMTEEARLKPSPSERLAERFAGAFIPFVLVLALGSGLIWWKYANLVKAGSVALAVLVVACPCAMGIAAPLATALALARAARRGIVVRGGDVLERLGLVDTFFFDKTGTLTVGRPVIQKIERIDPAISEDELLAWSAGLESASQHAIGRAVVDLAKTRNLGLGTVRDVQTFPGLGLCGWVTQNGLARQITVGTPLFVQFDSNVAFPVDDPAIIIEIAWDGKTRGRFYLDDEIRADASAVIFYLHRKSIETVLLSGDRATTARDVANRLQIPRCHAPCRPEEKIQILRAAVAAGKIVAMVGDGINDAPALAWAHVGIALGAGTDLARYSSHVVLLSDHLYQIPWLMRLGRRTRHLVTQNLLWAFGYNAVALVAAAAGLLGPLLAALAMVVSSLTVIANSLRLQNFPEGTRPLPREVSKH